MKVALVQMKVLAGEVEKNRAHGLALAAQAAANADVVVLPEVWTTGYSLRGIDETSEDLKGPTITALIDIAKKNKTNIIAGSIALKKEGKVYNTSVVINEQGEIITTYEKIHLFSMFNEQRFFAQGNKRCEFNCAGFSSGLGICYDLRFPELFRAMAVAGAKIVYLPAEWPTVRGDNWRLLNQARAVENQVYICAVNCVGYFKDSQFYGHSLFIAPNGEILVEGSYDEEILYGEALEEEVDKVRAGMSVLKDRRPEMYI